MQRGYELTSTDSRRGDHSHRTWQIPRDHPSLGCRAASERSSVPVQGTVRLEAPGMAKAPAGTLYRGREGMWSWVAHRVTGVLIFFFLFVHVLDTSLVRVSPQAYDNVVAT